MQPIVLQGKLAIPAAHRPSAGQVYDASRQLWINRATGIPVVIEAASARHESSRYGETTLTESREGADQSEVAAIDLSRFGETTLTRSQEGADAAEGMSISRFGETQITATAECVDAPDHGGDIHDAANSDLAP